MLIILIFVSAVAAYMHVPTADFPETRHGRNIHLQTAYLISICVRAGRPECHILGDQIDEKERLVLPCAAMALKNKLFCCLGVVEHDRLKVDFLVPCIAF